jgi:hypothetical protein
MYKYGFVAKSLKVTPKSWPCEGKREERDWGG